MALEWLRRAIFGKAVDKSHAAAHSKSSRPRSVSEANWLKQQLQRWSRSKSCSRLHRTFSLRRMLWRRKKKNTVKCLHWQVWLRAQQASTSTVVVLRIRHSLTEISRDQLNDEDLSSDHRSDTWKDRYWRRTVRLLIAKTKTSNGYWNWREKQRHYPMFISRFAFVARLTWFPYTKCWSKRLAEKFQFV